MSQRTLELLNKTVSKNKAVDWKKKFREIADIFVNVYGTPTLGNYRDPIKEILYILLSVRTTESQYRSTHRALFKKFSTLPKMAEATFDEIRECIYNGGLINKRVHQIREIARVVDRELGSNPSKKLKMMDEKEAYLFLTSLPGSGPKSALCVMMYSLDFDVFPVDVNVQRIASRIGAIPSNLRHYQAQNILPGLIPTGHSKDLHIGFVLHGRKICFARKPLCLQCKICKFCKTGRANKNGK